MATLLTTCSLLFRAWLTFNPEDRGSTTTCTGWHYITEVTAVKTSSNRVYFVSLNSSHIYDLNHHVMPIAFLSFKLVFHFTVTWLQGHVMDHVTLLFTHHWCHLAPTSVLKFFIGVIFHMLMECIKHTRFFNARFSMGVQKYVKQYSNTPTDN
jgi:hypothetical protein